MSPGCVFDFGRPMEVTLALQRSRADDVWGTSGGVKLKTALVPGGAGRFGVAFSASTTADLLTGEMSNALVNIPVTFHTLENFKINVNGGWLYDRPNEFHWATWGAGFDWSVNDRISIIGEVFGQLGQSLVDQPHLNDPRAQVAFRLKPNENLDFDVIYGRNITGENAHWITVGLNVRFNAFGERAAESPPIRRPLIHK